MYICITEVDAVTKIPCTVEPQRTGPSMPAVKGWVHLWHDKSTWPVATAADGTYLRAPKYYGTCDDDADTTIAGVLQVLTEAEYTALRTAEHEGVMLLDHSVFMPDHYKQAQNVPHLFL